MVSTKGLGTSISQPLTTVALTLNTACDPPGGTFTWAPAGAMLPVTKSAVQSAASVTDLETYNVAFLGVGPSPATRQQPRA